ncbi:MAG: accessory factor UbiK family protein [Gammaproteobacteria bacterium]|nr:accessory factor UbiK family protein [Gammaproteobacteria bacterium]
MNDEFISDLARRLRRLVPPSAEGAARDLETNFRALLQSALGRSDYVTFEEFEAQKRVLERTRSKVESLERTLTEMKSGGD